MFRGATDWLFSSSDLSPHGFCLLWEPWLIWSHVVASTVIGLAYIAIPAALVRLALSRKDLAFRPAFWLFAAFITLCGITHWFDLLLLWVPVYRLASLVLLAAAAISGVTAVAVWRLLPFAVAVPAPAEMQAAALALRESEALLRMSIDIGRIGSYRHDISRGVIHCPPEMRLMHGFAGGAAPVPDTEWLAMLVPEDRVRVEQALQDAHAALRQEVAVEYRFMHPARGLLHFEQRCRVDYDAAGRPCSAIGVVIDITERRCAEDRLLQLAHYDTLTGLPNRNLLHIRLDEAMARAGRGENFSVFCLDLDHFKDINEMFGHSFGDALLQAVTDRIVTALRPTDTVARLGGDEFAVIQSRIDGPMNAAALAERLTAILEAPFDIKGNQIAIGASMGIALAEDGVDGERLLRNADMAMYAAKADGRRRYRFFQAEMDERVQARYRMEVDLRRAVENGEFELLYQPVVSVATRRVTGFEALLRWNHPTDGLVMPDRFISLAETTGLILPIGASVLRQACEAAAQWPQGLRVAVNLSAVQFANGDLLGDVTAALADSGLDPRRLELEITESVMLRDIGSTLETLHALKALGISIAMDDFGTGYSSLSYLQKFPFDRLKIDRGFITSIEEAPASRAIAEAVVLLCNGLGIATVAEGVESGRVLAVLDEIGCGEAQGFYFSAARRAAQVGAVIEELGVGVMAGG